jgi:hypothetical protein
MDKRGCERVIRLFGDTARMGVFSSLIWVLDSRLQPEFAQRLDSEWGKS